MVRNRMGDSIYTDRRSRSVPAHVDPSLRRRMSCMATLFACEGRDGRYNAATERVGRCLVRNRMGDSIYTDRRSRSVPAHVDPSLRRRMSCMATLFACEGFRWTLPCSDREGWPLFGSEQNGRFDLHGPPVAERTGPRGSVAPSTDVLPGNAVRM